MRPDIERNPVTVAKLVSNVESPSVAPATAAVDNSSLCGTRAAVIVFSYYPSDPRVMRAAEAMSNAGMAVDLLCLKSSAQELSREQINAVDVFRVDLKKRRAGKLSYAAQYLTFLVLSFFWLSRHQLARHYDLVHVHNMPDFLVFSAGLAKLLGSRVVLDLHDPMPEVFITVYGLKPNNWLVRLLRIIEGLSISFADLVLTPNIAFRNLFVSRNCPPGKIAIVMNSPLEKVFPLREPANKSASDGPAGSEFVVMFHGTVVQRHGLHIAIEAVARLREHIPGLRFHIYGEPTAYLREQVVPLVAKLGLEDRIRYFGEQPQDIIAEAVAACDLGVVPNLRTVFTEINLPTRIFEYVALGKPVIVPETQGIRDYFDTDSVLFFKGGDVESLAAQIQWVFDHPDKTQAIVREGQKVYRRHFWKEEERRLLGLIAGLVRKAP
jgi:glycosyltransferase involved in cell wall biosynthesis